MKGKKEEKTVLQIPSDYILEDGDGYYLFPLPLIAYVQRLDGDPIDGKRYIRIKIDSKGKVESKLS